MEIVHKPKKSLGQNFLTDRELLHTIILFAGVTKGDNVLEIGPGKGALTEALLQAGANVRAVELDKNLAGELAKHFAGSKSFSFRQGNILETPLSEFYQREDKYKVVANIPYYITAPIVKKLLTEEPGPESITLLVQKEVAERLAGGSKERSVLTVATQFYSAVTLGPVVPKEYFSPVPKIDSQLVTLVPKRKAQPEDIIFFRLVRAGFAARRKTLFNNLVAARLASKERIQEVFVELNWPVTRRAQELEITEWQQLQATLFV